MSNPHNYQENRDTSNPKVDWCVETLLTDSNEVVVKSTAIKHTLERDEAGNYEGVDVNSTLVDDTFKVNRIG